MNKQWNIVRVLIGLVLMAVAVPFLIQGGFSRYAKYGIPPHPDWRYLLIGLIIIAVANVLMLPYWRHYFRKFSR